MLKHTPPQTEEDNAAVTTPKQTIICKLCNGNGINPQLTKRTLFALRAKDEDIGHIVCERCMLTRGLNCDLPLRDDKCPVCDKQVVQTRRLEIDLAPNFVTYVKRALYRVEAYIQRDLDWWMVAFMRIGLLIVMAGLLFVGDMVLQRLDGVVPPAVEACVLAVVVLALLFFFLAMLRVDEVLATFKADAARMRARRLESPKNKAH